MVQSTKAREFSFESFLGALGREFRVMISKAERREVVRCRDKKPQFEVNAILSSTNIRRFASFIDGMISGYSIGGLCSYGDSPTSVEIRERDGWRMVGSRRANVTGAKISSFLFFFIALGSLQNLANSWLLEISLRLLRMLMYLFTDLIVTYARMSISSTILDWNLLELSETPARIWKIMILRDH